MQILVEGVGAVGARTARQLADAAEVERVHVGGTDERRTRAVAASCGPHVVAVRAGQSVAGVDAVVLAGRAGTHAGSAAVHLGLGRHVVSVSDDLADVQGLLDLGAEARERGLTVVAGAGFSPGLSCLLVRHAAEPLDRVEQVHVARVGAGGPACAEQRRRALRGQALQWTDQRWERRRAGGGPRICWFPDPVGGMECRVAALPDPLLLVPALPDVVRVTARLGAGPLERLSARLRLPARHPEEGPLGAVWVEVRGRRGPATETVVLGALDRPAVAAGAVAALAARGAATGRFAPGAGGLASADPGPMLGDLAAVGVKGAVFEHG